MSGSEVEAGTEEQEEAAPDDAAKGKKTKKPKKEKAPKKKKGEEAEDSSNSGELKVSTESLKKGKSKGKGSSIAVITIMILVVVVLISGFLTAMVFGILGTRDVVADVMGEPLMDFMIWLDPRLAALDQRVEARAADADRRAAAREAELDAREGAIVFFEEDLAIREAALDRRFLELESREAQVVAMYERATPIHRRTDITEQDIEDMVSLSRTYTQMAPDSAAEIMIRIHDPRDVAAILYFMSERNAAAILAAMEPHVAAEITEILLYH